MPFIDSLDIANRSCTILGSSPITSITEDSVKNVALTDAYDKLRRPELRRNVWRFAIRKCVLRPIQGFVAANGTTPAVNPTMLLLPPQYSSTETYTAGAIVVDTNNFIWLSMQEENVGNTPGGNNEQWEAYFGQMTAQPYDTTGTTAYYAGELVYVQAPTSPTSPPLYQIYMSLTNSNADVPNTPTPWVSTTTFYGGQTVSYSGSYWQSLIELNLNNTPVQAPAQWSATTAYTVGNRVAGSDSFVYTALGNTTGNNPANNASPGNWTNTGTLAAWTSDPNTYPSDVQWAPIIGCTMKNIQFSYPLGAGPTYDSSTKNAYRLPANYLRQANQDPKAGTVSILGAPTGRMFSDWEFEGNYITTMDSSPLIFRFVADIVKVRDFDDLFAEGLASRMAFESCERITQATDKQELCMKNYNKAMGEARGINAIELGAEEAPVDDWISTRL